MITFHRVAGGRLESATGTAPASLDEVHWIDLCDPSREEESAIESLLGLQVPTRQEMSEIEESARLYTDGGALVMTAVVVSGATEGRPRRTQVTFLLTDRHLVTVRYADPMPFRTFAARIGKAPASETASAPLILVSLLESFVERIADVLEAIAADLSQVSDDIFYDTDPAGARRRKRDLQALITVLGRKNGVLAILRESLLGFGRIVSFVKLGGADWLRDGAGGRLKSIERDIRSLAAFEGQLEQQIAFLHEATLGLINIEQNAIIKGFSIAAVLFLPPTLVGTVYGMNFEVMPELSWRYGYPFAIATMVISALLPYWWFKRRGWL